MQLLIQTILTILKRNFNLYKRIGLIILIVIFFLSNYHICNYFYPLEDEASIELWWMLKIDIYVLIVTLCFILAAQKETNNTRLRLIERFITSVGIGLAISNIIDRRIYGTREYTKIDLLMVIVIILVSYYDFKRLSKIAKKHTHENP